MKKNGYFVRALIRYRFKLNHEFTGYRYTISHSSFIVYMRLFLILNRATTSGSLEKKKQAFQIFEEVIPRSHTYADNAICTSLRMYIYINLYSSVQRRLHFTFFPTSIIVTRTAFALPERVTLTSETIKKRYWQPEIVGQFIDFLQMS